MGRTPSKRIGWAEVDPVEHGFHFAQKIGMSQHHAFGIGGGSGGVEQGSDVIRLRMAAAESSRATLEDRRQVCQPLFAGVLRHALRVHEHEPNVLSLQLLPAQVRHVFASQKRAEVPLSFQQLSELVGVQRGIERDRRCIPRQ